MLGHFDDTDARQQNNAHEHPPGEHTEDHSFGRRAAGGPRVGASPARAPRGTTAGGVPDGTPPGDQRGGTRSGLATTTRTDIQRQQNERGGAISSQSLVDRSKGIPRCLPCRTQVSRPHRPHRGEGGGRLARALGVVGRRRPLDGLQSIPEVSFLQPARPLFHPCKTILWVLAGTMMLDTRFHRYSRQWKNTHKNGERVSFNPSRHNVECYGRMEIENILFTSAQMRTRL